jgi:excinuclease ABC subunit C
MEGYSQKLEYEKAQVIKKTIEGLEYLNQSTSIQAYLENPNFLEEQNKLSLLNLQHDLNLTKKPTRIECFDISNLQGKFATGSLVVLTNGETDKKWYRKFKIKREGKPNDTAMMKEVIRRRLGHQEWPKPDLILVDGGKGQVGAAKEAEKEQGLNIPIFGLAKKEEWLYGPKEQIIKLPKSSLSLRLLQKVRDEAHRFALSYHHHLRKKYFP